jgi:hypothetical protein
MTQHDDVKATQLVIETRAKKLASLHLDGLARPAINTLVAAIVDGLDDDAIERCFYRAEELIELLPRQRTARG